MLLDMPSKILTLVDGHEWVIHPGAVFIMIYAYYCCVDYLVLILVRDAC